MVVVYVQILYPGLFQFAEALWYVIILIFLIFSGYKVLNQKANYLDGNVKCVTVQST